MATRRHDWTTDAVLNLLERPFHDLLADAHQTYRENFDPHLVEGAMLLSIKTGGCPEHCAYCPQSARSAGRAGGRAITAVSARRMETCVTLGMTVRCLPA